MNVNVLSILEYETYIAPGGFFQLKTDWFETDQEINSIIIDQSNVFSKILSIYPRDFYLYLEQNEDGSLYRSNYPLVLNKEEGHYTVLWSEP